MIPFFLCVLIVWVFSVCLHEFAHAIVAYWGGDRSVADKGYLSFNPLRYTHPVSSLILPVVFLLLGGIGLPGGAVYINEEALRSRRWRSAVSLAGPAANGLLLVLLASPFLLGVFKPTDKEMLPALVALLAGLQATSLLFNLLPVPPLDGFGVIAPFMPPRLHQQILQMGQWPFFVLLMVLLNHEKTAFKFWSLVADILRQFRVPWNLFADGWNAFTFWR